MEKVIIERKAKYATVLGLRSLRCVIQVRGEESVAPDDKAAYGVLGVSTEPSPARVFSQSEATRE